MNVPATATCGQCQAGSCGDCQQQGCSWFASTIPGVSGKCDVNSSTSNVYTLVATCPVCQNYDTSCTTCVAREAIDGCGWYVLPGSINGKCREAAPSFAYSKTPSDSCSSGNLCAGIPSCSTCQTTNASASAANSSTCSWYKSKQPNFYNSKCDDNKPSAVETGLYDQVMGTCPVCGGTTCIDCKAEAGCKWVAVSQGLGTAFGQCLPTATATPTVKKEITTCPAVCNVHSCASCITNSACNWFTSGGMTVDDSCDLASDATFQHPFQQPVPTKVAQCPACAADRCYECNNLAGCGWYVKRVGFVDLAQGCYATNAPPSGRTLRSNTDSKCSGVPSSSTHVAASLGLVLILACFA